MQNQFGSIPGWYTRQHSPGPSSYTAPPPGPSSYTAPPPGPSSYSAPPASYTAPPPSQAQQGPSGGQPVVYFVQGASPQSRSSAPQMAHPSRHLQSMNRPYRGRQSWQNRRMKMVPNKNFNVAGRSQIKIPTNRSTTSKPQMQNTKPVRFPKKKMRSVAIQCLWEEEKEWPSIAFVSARDWDQQFHGLWGQNHHWSLCRSERKFEKPGFKTLEPSNPPDMPQLPVPWVKQLAQVTPKVETQKSEAHAVAEAMALRNENQALSLELQMIQNKFTNIEGVLKQLLSSNARPNAAASSSNSKQAAGNEEET